MAEKQLAAAVIARAIEDLSITGVGDGDLAAINEARSFLTNPSGPWRRAREFWCEVAEIDPSRLVTYAEGM